MNTISLLLFTLFDATGW